MIFDDFDAIPHNRYDVIAADPPWTFRTYSAKGEGRSASRHYGTMSADDIAGLPVADLARRDCALLLWGTSPNLLQVIHVMSSWGFAFKGKAFSWAKTNTLRADRAANDPSTWFMGMGYHTRSNTEDCWLGTIGNPKRISASIRELIVAPRREHSRKPDEFYTRAEQLYGGTRIDLFARETRPGWDSFGNEVGKYGAA